MHIEPFAPWQPPLANLLRPIMYVPALRTRMRRRLAGVGCVFEKGAPVRLALAQGALWQPLLLQLVRRERVAASVPAQSIRRIHGVGSVCALALTRRSTWRPAQPACSPRRVRLQRSEGLHGTIASSDAISTHEGSSNHSSDLKNGTKRTTPTQLLPSQRRALRPAWRGPQGQRHARSVPPARRLL